MAFLKALFASLWPQHRRRWWQPESPDSLLHATVVSAVIEWVVFGYLEFLQFRAHFLALANHFAPGNEGTQTAGLLVVVAAEFFYPLSLLCIYFCAEGFVRALAAVMVGETLPSLPFVIVSAVWDRLTARRSNSQARSFQK